MKALQPLWFSRETIRAKHNSFENINININFQMIVKTNNAIAIATLSDWLKSLALVFQPVRSKTNRTLLA